MKFKIEGRKIPDIELEIPLLGVTLIISGTVLTFLARKAHNNRTKKSRSGPVSVRATGPRPSEFNNRFSVICEQVRETGSTHSVAARAATFEDALKEYEEQVAKKRWTSIKLMGPRSLQADVIDVIQEYPARKR